MEGNDKVISFHNLHYEVDQRVDDNPFNFKTAKKEILCGLSGKFTPGLNVIMGVTGSGKSTLLDVLAQRKDPAGLTDGLVLLDRNKLPENFRLISGYVVQSDILMGTLTVRENIMFSANLRLPSKTYSKQRVKDVVEKVIEELGLESCANTLIGNEFLRGVSGGEKKRTSIGVEMVLNPNFLFLDEPTTGLDANTAISTLKLLKKLASGGRNIIISIHQPRYSIFSLFDRLIILHKGRMVYRGLAKEAVDYFKDIGFVCPSFNNPADFFLDIIGGDVEVTQDGGNDKSNSISKRRSKIVDVEMARLIGSGNTLEAIEMKEDVLCDNAVLLMDEFLNSPKNTTENQELEMLMKDYKTREEKRNENHTFNINYANGFSKQLKLSVNRTFLNIVRTPMTWVMQVGVMIFFALMMGVVYFQCDTSFKSGLQNRAGCFFFLTTAQMFSNLNALEAFMSNRAHFIHESSSGYYRISVFFIANVFADLIPNRLLPTSVFCAIIYFMMGFQRTFEKFIIFLLTNFLISLCSSSLAFSVSASSQIFAVALLALSIPYIMMMLFGGFLVNIGSLLSWLKWLKYLSIFRYGINAFTVNEMSGLVFIDNTTYPGFNPNSSTPCISSLTHSYIQNCTTGETYMDLQGIEYGAWGLWQNLVALFVMTVSLLLISYIQLRRIRKYF